MVLTIFSSKLHIGLPPITSQNCLRPIYIYRMSFNLLTTCEAYFTYSLQIRAAQYLGESTTSVQKAFTGIIPALLNGFSFKTMDRSGSNIIIHAAIQQASTNHFENPAFYFENNGGALLNQSAKIYNNLLGDRAIPLTHLIANFAGISDGSASTLLSMATPSILGVLGNYIQSNQLDANQVSSFFTKQNLVNTIPSGLNLHSIFKLLDNQYKNSLINSNMSETQNGQSASNNGTALSLLLILLIVAIGAGITLYFWKSTEPAKQSIMTIIDSPIQKADNSFNHLAGKLNSAGDFEYELGDTISIDLPNKMGNLKVGKYSTEAKLVTFLQDGYANIDSVNGNWFEFTQVRFKPNSATLEPSSATQLKNIAAICQAFPKAIFSIGAFTDNTGNENDNLSISQQKANNLQTVLLELGAPRLSIRQSKGFGSANPVADNSTPAGRAQNRRVSINVKSKYER